MRFHFFTHEKIEIIESGKGVKALIEGEADGRRGSARARENFRHVRWEVGTRGSQSNNAVTHDHQQRRHLQTTKQQRRNTQSPTTKLPANNKTTTP